ncbi:MAG TPA: hypothetical protein VFJ57_13915 [Solirubrobacterales bacterium]|nr:hypothetical protein [Solirubrobacterales bacterium]
MPEPTDLALKVLAVHRHLTEAGLPHAIGGAVALGIYAEPRPTVDIDVNVFVAAEREPAVREALAGLDPDGKYPVHLFFDEDELHGAMREAIREVPFAGTTIPLVAPEHLVVRKVLLDRAKDQPDLERLVDEVDPLDLDEVERWLEKLGDAEAQAEFAALIAVRRR